MKGLVLLAVLAGALAPAPWRLLDGEPAPQVKVNAVCPAMHLPADWDVRSQVYADVTGDGVPECVLSVWRPWRDWPIARWSSRPTPIAGNHDAAGFSSHVALLRPRPDGAYVQLWVGSALFQPVTALTVRPGGELVTLETTYARGRQASSVALSRWRWTGFGFQIERRVPAQARELGVTPAGQVAVR